MSPLRHFVLFIGLATAVFAEPAASDTTRARLTIGVAGDSTVADRAESAHLCGWVQLLRRELKSDVVVHNLARGGRSSKSFIEEGLWQQLLARRPDFVLVQFGHNDSKREDYRRTDPATTYKDYLRRYADESAAAGALLVFITPMERRNFGADGKIQPTNHGYAQAMREVAAEKRVPVIDLHAHSVLVLEQMGAAASDALGSVATDRTHWSAAGAQRWADFIGRELRQLTDPRYTALVTAFL